MSRLLVFRAAASATACALFLSGCAEDASPSQSSTKFVRSNNPNPGSYIVVLRDTDQARAQSLDLQAQSLAVSYAGRITHTYGTALRGFAAEMSEDSARALAERDEVAYVEEDTMFHLNDVQPNATWGLDRIDERNLPLDGRYFSANSGAGVNVYIVDTGIHRTHREFGGRVRNGFTAIRDGNGTNDCNGHGTHVAGTVGSETFGVADDVALIPVRVLGCSGSSAGSSVIDGVNWIARNRVLPAVANMSVGGGASRALDQAVRAAVAAGVTVVVAAGNETQNACNVSPARESSAITVGASTDNDTRAGFSNFGSCVDIFAPGQEITSTWLSNGTNTIDGTSMASPHVAGVAALYLHENPRASPANVRSAILGGATPGLLSGIGPGSPNRLLYSGIVDTGPPPPGPRPPSGCRVNELGSALGQGVARGRTQGGSTGQTGSCVDSANAPEVAFRWTAPSTGTYRIDTQGSNFDTALYIRDNTCQGGELACDDDGIARAGASATQIALRAGDTVVIVVDGYGTNAGNYVLNIRDLNPGAPPPGLTCDSDNLGSALGFGVARGTTTGSDSQFAGSCSQSASAPDAAFRWRAPFSGRFLFDTRGSSYDTVLYLLEDSCDGRELACDDDAVSSSGPSAFAVTLQAGQQVVVVVDGYDRNSGTYSLNINQFNQ